MRGSPTQPSRTTLDWIAPIPLWGTMSHSSRNSSCTDRLSSLLYLYLEGRPWTTEPTTHPKLTVKFCHHPHHLYYLSVWQDCNCTKTLHHQEQWTSHCLDTPLARFTDPRFLEQLTWVNTNKADPSWTMYKLYQEWITRWFGVIIDDHPLRYPTTNWQGSNTSSWLLIPARSSLSPNPTSSMEPPKTLTIGWCSLKSILLFTM